MEWRRRCNVFGRPQHTEIGRRSRPPLGPISNFSPSSLSDNSADRRFYASSVEALCVVTCHSFAVRDERPRDGDLDHGGGG
jgi:hypothetical protein